MNRLDLRAELVRNKKTYDDLAQDLGISKGTLVARLDDFKSFKAGEILIIQKVLGLSKEDRDSIFFGD